MGETSGRIVNPGNPENPGKPENLEFFRGTFDETLELLVEARDYAAAARGAGAHGHLPVDMRLSLCCESLRVTARLTQVMAWILLQKAVHAGEISPQDVAGGKTRFDIHAACLKDDRISHYTYPPHLNDLLARSLGLLERILRLDERLAA